MPRSLPHHLRHLLNGTFNIRVLAYILVAMVPLFTVFNLIFLRSQQQSLQEHITGQGNLMVRMLAHNARLGVFAENPEMLKGPVEAVLGEAGVIEAAAYTPEGALLYRQSRPPVHGGPSPVSRPDNGPPDREMLLAGAGPMHRELDERYIFWAPVPASTVGFGGEGFYFDGQGTDETENRAIGLVNVVLDKSLLRQGLQAILVRNLVVMAVFLAMAVLAAYLVMREVNAPLHRLIANIRKHEIEVEPGNELGFLENTFDALVARLGHTFETITELKKGLEDKVLELELEVAERRQAEAALRESEETARVLLNAPTHVALLMDRDGTILDANEAMAQRFDKEVGAMIGSRFWDLLPEDEIMRQRHLAADRVLRQGEPIRFEDERQGEWFDNVFYPVRDIDGRVSKVAILARDITKRVLAERARRDMEIKSLTQAKLASLGEIATGMAHEINQPLSFLKVVYECILRDLDRDQLDLEELREDCGEALRQLGRITNIVNHLRAFGRSDAMNLGPVRLESVLHNTMILMAERIKLRNIAYSPSLERDLPAVHGNDIKLEQVFINLFQNSLDALAGVEAAGIAITMRRLDDEVEIRFADNGPGVPPAIAGKIFEPFFTTKEVGQGTGLGLSIVYGIVTEHRGTMRHEPLAGRGVAFVITLPVWREEMEEKDACDLEGNVHD